MRKTTKTVSQIKQCPYEFNVIELNYLKKGEEHVLTFHALRVQSFSLSATCI